MTDGKTEFFQRPAYKLLISDILKAVPGENKKDVGEGSDEEPDWYLTITEVSSKSGKIDVTSVLPLNPPVELHLKLIWVQGTVTRIEDSGENIKSLVITDDDGGKVEACIYAYDSVPGGDHPGIVEGSYVGALGQIWSNDPVVLKAAKVMHLDSKPIYKSIWRDEVSLSKAFFAGLIKPVL